MLKEIAEQPTAAADTLRGHLVDGRIVLDEQRLDDRELREIDKVFVVACGTAYHAGMIAKQAIEHWTRVPVEVEMASEFRYRDPVLDRQTLVVAISQSGETADTLEAVRHARDQQAKVLAICNTNGSQIPRESDAVLYTHAGPEIGVAATKTFIAQLVAVELLGLALAQARGTKYPEEIVAEYEALAPVPDLIAQTLSMMGGVPALAREIATARAVLFLGRHVGYPVALEGALKLKELAYMHAEGFPAGELKHGPIALIEAGLPVVVVMPSPTGRPVLHQKMLSNIAEITARGARTIVVAEAGDEVARADRRRPHRGAGRPRPCCRRSWRRSRCRSWPPRSPGPAASTSTSPATWPSRSPSNRGRRTTIAGVTDATTEVGRSGHRRRRPGRPVRRLLRGRAHPLDRRARLARGAGRPDHRDVPREVDLRCGRLPGDPGPRSGRASCWPRPRRSRRTTCSASRRSASSAATAASPSPPRPGQRIECRAIVITGGIGTFTPAPAAGRAASTSAAGWCTSCPTRASTPARTSSSSAAATRRSTGR